MLTCDRLKEFLSYDAATGNFTRLVRTANATWVGATAGYVNKAGYVYVSLLGSRYLAHRLAWLYAHGSWPAGNLDHADGNPGNNRLANLRECSQSQNIGNSKAKAGNRSGFKGVSFHSPRSKWRARITVAGKETLLGYFDSPEEAHDVYCTAARRSFKDFHRP